MILFFSLLKSIFFCYLNLISLFPYIKYYNIMFIIIVFLTCVFWVGTDRPSGLLFFHPCFTTFHTLHTSFVCFFVLFHCCCSMSECLGNTSCKSSPFPIAILNGTSFFRAATRSKSRRSKTTIIIILHSGVVTWSGNNYTTGRRSGVVVNGLPW